MSALIPFLTRRVLSLAISLCLVLAGAAPEAFAQATVQLPVARQVPAPPEPDAIPLYEEEAVLVGDRETWNEFAGQRVVRNVNAPSITPVLPDPARATGAAVIIAPGGAFLMLSIDNEGYQVARWFADRGIAAFVLKYRLRPTPNDPAEFRDFVVQAMAEAPEVAPENFQPAIEDAQQAVRLVREHAQEWAIDQDRIGMVGFSAGAAATIATALAEEQDARPDFVASIYGPMAAVPATPSVPPMFAALAADDPLYGDQSLALIESWRNAGRPYELHLYEAGGHGFGMEAKGTTSDLWISQFHEWLGRRGLLPPAASGSHPIAQEHSAADVGVQVMTPECRPALPPLFAPEQLLNPAIEELDFPTSFDPVILAAMQEAAALDPAGLCVYRNENSQLPPASSDRVVFIGDSITEGWRLAAPGLFTGDVHNRGIAGQTSSQVLLRFRADVIDLDPASVHIMVGTNDINTPAGTVLTRSNIRSMVDVARANGIRVILASTPPSSSFWIAPELRPAGQIVELNSWLRLFAAENEIAYIDYHTVLRDPEMGLLNELTNDGLHPNQYGYDRMTALIEPILH